MPSVATDCRDLDVALTSTLRDWSRTHMPEIETLTINLADGFVHRFSVCDGNGVIYAAHIETGGYGVRKTNDAPMTWYGPADVLHVAVHDTVEHA